jgi:hypothetical protein
MWEIAFLICEPVSQFGTNIQVIASELTSGAISGGVFGVPYVGGEVGEAWSGCWDDGGVGSAVGPSWVGFMMEREEEIVMSESPTWFERFGYVSDMIEFFSGLLFSELWDISEDLMSESLVVSELFCMGETEVLTLNFAGDFRSNPDACSIRKWPGMEE